MLWTLAKAEYGDQFPKSTKEHRTGEIKTSQTSLGNSIVEPFFLVHILQAFTKHALMFVCFFCFFLSFFFCEKFSYQSQLDHFTVKPLPTGAAWNHNSSHSNGVSMTLQNEEKREEVSQTFTISTSRLLVDSLLVVTAETSAIGWLASLITFW